MNAHVKFIAAFLEGNGNFSELCERFGICRKQGYKWRERYEGGGIDALRDRSRARCTRPHAVPNTIVDLIVEARKQHPRRGPIRPGTSSASGSELAGRVTVGSRHCEIARGLIVVTRAPCLTTIVDMIALRCDLGRRICDVTRSERGGTRAVCEGPRSRNGGGPSNQNGRFVSGRREVCARLIRVATDPGNGAKSLG